MSGFIKNLRSYLTPNLRIGRLAIPLLALMIFAFQLSAGSDEKPGKTEDRPKTITVEKINKIEKKSVYKKCPHLLQSPLSTGRQPCLKKTNKLPAYK